MATNSDPEALLSSEWQAWNIPLSQLTNVNLAAVKKLYIGVGNRTSPQAGGSGVLYIDDLQVGRMSDQ